MTVFDLGGQRVVVSAKTRYYYVYRRQGLTVQVNPKSHWWCAWQCTTHTEIDSIRCRIELIADGVVDHVANGGCSDCGKMALWGPAMYGFSVPAKYQSVRYSGVAVIDDDSFPFNGVEFYGTPPL